MPTCSLRWLPGDVAVVVRLLLFTLLVLSSLAAASDPAALPSGAYFLSQDNSTGVIVLNVFSREDGLRPLVTLGSLTALLNSLPGAYWMFYDSLTDSIFIHLMFQPPSIEDSPFVSSFAIRPTLDVEQICWNAGWPYLAWPVVYDNAGSSSGGYPAVVFAA
jgi:hypothetical protein